MVESTVVGSIGVKSSSEASLFVSNDDVDELSMFKRLVSQKYSFIDILKNKYMLGSAISDVLSGTDLDAFTLLQLWNTQKTSQTSLIISNQSVLLSNEKNDTVVGMSRDYFGIYYQQLCYSWQSKLDLLNRDRSIYQIPPQKSILIHIIDPKMISLVILTYVYKLYKINFIGLYNEPDSGIIPGPYLGLLRFDNREDYFKCLNIVHDGINNKLNKLNDVIGLDSGVDYINFAYFITELDYIYGYILINNDCYKYYTEPLLLQTYTNWLYGKISLLFYMYRMRKRYYGATCIDILNRFNILLSLICNILSNEFNDDNDFNLRYNIYLITFISIIYSYLYAILSIPIHLLFWEVLSNDDYNAPYHYLHACDGIDRNDSRGTVGIEGGEGKSTLGMDGTRNIEGGNQKVSGDDNHLNDNDYFFNRGSSYGSMTSAEDEYHQDYPRHDDPSSLMPIFSSSFSNDFSYTAADSTCVENTKRCDTIMSHVIGYLTGEGNWIKRKENYNSVIDTYKLGLAWYKRPSFSNTLCNTNYKAWSIALLWYYLIIAPCGRAWFTWCWKNHEGWGSNNIWSYLHDTAPITNSLYYNIKQHINKFTSNDGYNTTCTLCLKRIISLRIRDVISYMNDIEFQLKKATLYY